MFVSLAGKFTREADCVPSGVPLIKLTPRRMSLSFFAIIQSFEFENVSPVAVRAGTVDCPDEFVFTLILLCVVRVMSSNARGLVLGMSKSNVFLATSSRRVLPRGRCGLKLSVAEVPIIAASLKLFVPCISISKR